MLSNDNAIYEGTQCPLCLATNTQLFSYHQHKPYLLCQQCHYTFLLPAFWLTAEQEAQHYQLHQNDVDDPHYRRFLNRLYQPLKTLLNEHSHGIDMGCGPGPALAKMFQEDGLACEHYDPLFFPNETLLTQSYDFVTCTEVVEHLRKPHQMWQQLKQLVKPNGYLAIMTSWRVEQADFSQWHYPRDPTHIGFYQPQTFRWLEQQWHWPVCFPANNVAIYQCPAHARPH